MTTLFTSSLRTYDQLKAEAIQTMAMCLQQMKHLVRFDTSDPHIHSQLVYQGELFLQMYRWARANITSPPLTTSPPFTTSPPPPLVRPPPSLPQPRVLLEPVITYDAARVIIQVD